MKLLKQIELDQDTYFGILDYYSKLEDGVFLKSGNYEEFKYGHYNKLAIIVDKANNCFISNIYNLEEYGIKCTYRFDKYNYQVLVKLNNDEDFKNDLEDLKSTYTPLQAVRTMNKMLHKHYTSAEIDERLNMFTQDNWIPQMHTTVYDTLSDYYGTSDTDIISNDIHLYKDCYYYDINGAHTMILSKIFPKAKEDLEYWNDHKKDPGKEYYKKIPNYYVGCLGKKGSKHRKTYNWIVNQVNDIVRNALDYAKPKQIVYINTDGFIMQHPENIITPSKKLGEFKLESKGNVYIYKNQHYDIIEYTKITGEKKHVGALLNRLKPHIDLANNTVIDYVSVKNRDTNSQSISNIREIKKNVKIHN